MTDQTADMSAEAIPPFNPLVPLLLLMAMVTGIVDAVSVLGLGKVFTANMTGNIVFFGFAVVGTPGFGLAPHLTALAGFILGAVLAGRIGRSYAPRSRRAWLLMAAVFEATLLWIGAGLAVGFDVARQAPGDRLYVLIVLASVAMGFRNATIRQLKIADLTTTVLTTTLTGLFADSFIAGGVNPNWHRRVASIGAILFGAIIGAAMVKTVGLPLPMALAGVLVVLGTASCVLHPAWTRFAAQVANAG